jgi:hypothetical protein
MIEFSSKDKQIFDDMKQCIKDLGLKILDEKTDENILSGFSTFEYPSYNMGIIFSYNPSINVAEILLRYADMPTKNIPALHELLNDINGNLTFNHFYIDPKTKILVLRSGLYVTGYFLNKEAFKILLVQNLGVSHTFMPLIAKLISTDQTPTTIMDEFYAKKDKITTEFLGPDGKVKKPKVTKELPFIIEASADIPAFPTHTHGLTELGMPEFLIDHLAFGADGNGGRINSSYDYFIKPENAGKLDGIKNGQTIKLTDKDLKPSCDHPEPYVYCYRRVYPDFEMVKQAYLIEDPNDIDPKMWFVQIYVDGDDFALTDDYYRGGIKW